MPTTPKLLSLADAAARRERLRALGRRVVLTNGVFDLLHPGHIASLQASRALGDALFVCINSDESVRALKGPKRPILGEQERAFCLGALECVDTVLIFRTPRLDAEINALRPDVYTKAGDYAPDRLDPAERRALELCGAEIRFTPFVDGFSTTGIVERIHALNTP